MTSPSPQVPVEKKKSNTTLIIVIVALLFLFVILPLCVILAIIAIIAANPAGNVPSPTPMLTVTEAEPVWDTVTPTMVIIEEPSNNIRVNGQDWTQFTYTLPVGQVVSGYAPPSHAFGNDYVTSSDLGNSFSFNMINQNNLLNMKFTVTEAAWLHYEEGPLTTFQGENGKTVYKFSDTRPNTVYYTDSYQIAGCEQYPYFGDGDEAITNNPCGTGTMFNHRFLVTCEYEEGKFESTWVCDEIMERIKIN